MAGSDSEAFDLNTSLGENGPIVFLLIIRHRHRSNFESKYRNTQKIILVCV